MTTFVAIGHHGPLTEAEALDIAERQVAWFEARLADKSIHQIYALVGGGRLVIGEAGSAADFEALLASGPDAPTREWSRIAELRDGLEVARDYVQATREAARTETGNE
ncbi:hypothetical protein [Rhodococcus globerulus]|uniref:Uncharacterized protein n=1 Tax=Rhodococcus globerulus TaxID=33008 RepID=A0ABU4C3Z1_RHOGO|nr:hypothetical protein [Rhodococcus globerulus]MDV6271202.1 hypothetical protein [Rhodococcus globerulus]